MRLELTEISICFSLLGLFFGCIIIGYLLKMITENQHHAYFGDKDAARHLLLPCYKPLFRSLWVSNILLIFVQLLILFFSSDSSLRLICVQFCEMSSITLQTIPGVLLIQPSVSRSGFWRTGFIIFPWWIISTITWILMNMYPTLISRIVFIIISAIPSFALSLFMLIGFLPSRIRLGSRSNRVCMEFLFVHSLFYLVALLMSLSISYPIHIAFGLMIFFSSQIFPVVLYLCLLADTKFWRGIGKHNIGGLVASDSQSLPLPELTMTVVANEFQKLIADVSSYFIDFAFIRVGPMVGSGASADVYLGEYKRKPVVLKISTPPEVTASELLIIRKETLIHSKLTHPCIVKFIGVCIRPPQIGMVVEYCDNGNLRESLQNQFILWTPQRRMNAILDACRAVNYLHSMGYMHRDIKAENFFVTNLYHIKLGDFGEAVELKSYLEDDIESNTNNNNNGNNKLQNSMSHSHRHSESYHNHQTNTTGREAETRKMTILGTIAYMAPELVEGKRYYTQSIDVYALTITLWQIWTGIEPYQGVDTFSLYKLIMSGVHPDLPLDSPEGFNDALSAGWNSNSEQRLTSKELLDRINNVVIAFLNKSNDDSSETASLLSKIRSNSCGNPLTINVQCGATIPRPTTPPPPAVATTTTSTTPRTATVTSSASITGDSEALEMLGSSSFFEDSNSGDVEEFPSYYHHDTPFKKIKGWHHHHLHHHPHHHLHPQNSNHSKPRTISHYKNSNVTPKRLFRFFSIDDEENLDTHPPLEIVEDDNQENNNNNNETNQDLYQSYNRDSTTATRQNPILSIFPNKFTSFW